jgi:hypothetical protein
MQLVASRRVPGTVLARLVVLLMVLAAAPACRPDHVRVTYRPRPGSVAVYRVRVHAVVTTTIADRPPRRTEEDGTFTARHAVLQRGDRESEVQVRLTSSVAEPRTFVVSIDRGGQLTAVRSVEGLPADILGGLGISEVFPAAAGAPPDRPLHPATRWLIDEPVALTAGPVSRLVGTGQVVGFGVVHGRRLIELSTAYSLDAHQSGPQDNGTIVLDGQASTAQRTARNVADGVVESADATTTGRFAISVTPDGAGVAVPGTLTLEVTSHTHRIA